MKSLVALLLIGLLLTPPLGFLGAQELPVAALARISALGKISEVQKRIIFTRVESKLSLTYDLVSQEQYARAEEAAFESLDLAQCTEEQCIRKIQEILQVDRLFVLHILSEEGLTQLSLNLIREDSKVVVEAICENCPTVQLYGKIDKLMEQLIAKDLSIDLRALVAEQPEAKTALEREVAQIEEEDEGGISFWWWILGGLALAAAASGGGGGGEAAAPATTPVTTPTPTGNVTVTY